MEHIVQFAIGIDDDAIIKNVMANAEKNITKELSDKIMPMVFRVGTNWDGRKTINGVLPWVEEQFDKFLEEYKEDIINAAADKLADKLSRSKIVKETVANSVAGGK